MKSNRIIWVKLLSVLLAVSLTACGGGGGGGGGRSSETTAGGNGGTAIDIDGNIYHTVTIGKQVWMVENLKVTKYNNGTAIPLVTDDTAWGNLTTGGYCWYNNNDVAYKNTYGALYNWYAVNTGKLAPAGWHVPTSYEWNTLTTYLGGMSVAGGKLKETGTTHWQSPNTGATNESGFTALPGGRLNGSGGYCHIGMCSNWWSSTELEESADFWGNYYEDSSMSPALYNKHFGFSVRCIKN